MNNIKGILSAIISSTTFGLIPLFSIPLLREGVGTPSILLYRLGIAAFVIGLIAVICGKSLRITWHDLKLFIYLGALYAATSLGLLMAYNYIPSGVATTIHFLYPLVVTLIMIVLFHEKRSLWLLFAALVSLLGVGLLSWSSGNSSAELRGVMLVLITVVTYAVYIVSVNKLSVRKMDSLVVTFYVLTCGSVVFLIYALLGGGIEALPSMGAVRNAVLLALLPTVLSNFALVVAVKNIGSTTTSILGSMEPLTAMLIGVFYFSEIFSARSVIGMGMILISVIIVILLNRDQNRDV